MTAAGGDNPFDALTYELKQIEVKRTQEKEPLGVFMKAMVAGGQPYVARMADGSPAVASGLKAGDYVLAINGHRIESKSHMAEEISRIATGTIFMTISRRRPTPLDPLTLKPPGNAPRRSDFIYHICRLDPMRRPTVGLTLQVVDNMVAVAKVNSSGAASWAGMQVRDRLLAINSEEIRDLQHCEELLKNNVEGKLADILIERHVSAATLQSASEENPSLVLQRLSIIRGQPSAGVPQTPPELKAMLENRLAIIMKGIMNRGVKAKVKSSVPSGGSDRSGGSGKSNPSSGRGSDKAKGGSDKAKPGGGSDKAKSSGKSEKGETDPEEKQPEPEQQ